MANVHWLNTKNLVVLDQTLPKKLQKVSKGPKKCHKTLKTPDSSGLDFTFFVPNQDLLDNRIMFLLQKEFHPIRF